MRTGVLVGYVGGKARVIREPQRYDIAATQFKGLANSPTPEFEAIELWGSDSGITKRHKFKGVKPAILEPEAPKSKRGKVDA